MGVSNPRFPHWCKVYRVTGENPFDDKREETLLYEGRCAKYGTNNLRTFFKEGVEKADYAVDIPGLVEGILPGDTLDYADYQGRFTGCGVADSYASAMGTTVYFNVARN
jgi:hypothetical protein